MALLLSVTTFLATVYRDARDTRAERHYLRGRALARDGHDATALEEYRAALALVREHSDYERALVQSLMRLGRYGEAETWATDLLRRHPTDGPTNRALARLERARGEPREARAYFQRAIYGDWPQDEHARRIETRFELLAHLQEQQAEEEVLAELLRLKAEIPPVETASIRRLASLLMDNGRIQDAGDMLRAAQQEAPDDSALRRQVEETARTLALDPMLPGLRLRERVRRARLLLRAVVEHIDTCPQAAMADDLARLARAQLAIAGRTAADAEDDLQLARQLWHASGDCSGASGESQAIGRVLKSIEAAEDASS